MASVHRRMHYLGDEWIHKLENMISKIARELPTDRFFFEKKSRFYTAAYDEAQDGHMYLQSWHITLTKPVRAPKFSLVVVLQSDLTASNRMMVSRPPRCPSVEGRGHGGGRRHHGWERHREGTSPELRAM